MRGHMSTAGFSHGAVRLLLTAAVLLLLNVDTVSADQAAWQQWQHLPGVVDVAARADGTLVAMVGGHFVSLTSDGRASPFAAGADGYTGVTPDAESYFIIVPAAPTLTNPSGCSFAADDLFVLDLTSPPGIARVDPQGHASHFATLTGVDTLGGIALDTTGQFGFRLLVTGTHNGNQTTIFAIDCSGASTVITAAAPPMEGGLAVAPASFGQFGGALIAPDENTGQLWAIDPSGQTTVVSVPNLPTGGDTGVESLGFVGRGFSDGGFAYLADRGTPNNPFPGTDSLLRLASDSLVSAGIQDGDLLVSTEGNGTTVAVRCAQTCTILSAASGTDGGHIEGKIAVVANHPAP